MNGGDIMAGEIIKAVVESTTQPILPQGSRVPIADASPAVQAALTNVRVSIENQKALGIPAGKMVHDGVSVIGNVAEGPKK